MGVDGGIVLNIALFGFMGVGKTTVGRLLAARLRYDFVDTDNEIEREVKMRVSEVFSGYGEPTFRRMERRVVARLANLDKHVFALGGGTVLDEANVEMLRASTRMVLLMASPGEIMIRIRGDSTRPLLKGGNKLSRIRELLDSRREAYLAAADWVLDTNGLPPVKVTDALIKRLEGME